MFLYGYTKCSTCQFSLKFLKDSGYNPEFIDFIENRLSEKELRNFLSLSGQDIDKCFNTSGILYREMDLKNKLTTMSYDEKISLLASDGMLIKRPLLVNGTQVIFGFNKTKIKSTNLL